jgi:hypothetical protein
MASNLDAALKVAEDNFNAEIQKTIGQLLARKDMTADQLAQIEREIAALDEATFGTHKVIYNGYDGKTTVTKRGD